MPNLVTPFLAQLLLNKNKPEKRLLLISLYEKCSITYALK